MQDPRPGKSDHRCILRERLARWTKRLLRYRSALILAGFSAQDLGSQDWGNANDVSSVSQTARMAAGVLSEWQLRGFNLIQTG